MADLSFLDNRHATASASNDAAQSLIPPPPLMPSEWAEANVLIPVGNAKPGPIRFDNAPYQRGMIDAIAEPGVRRVSMMTGAQLGKTTVQQCWTGYFIAHEPRSQIMVQPTQGDVQTYLETKLRPMLDANPSISSKMAKQRGREGVNNSRIISYIGGWLMFSWAGSPKTLRGRSAPVTHADEIDGYEATPEGDPGELLAQRSASFGDDALRTESSTPTIKGESRIETAFQLGDQRRYMVPCPDCGHHQHLRWEQVTWSGRQSTGVDDFEKDLPGIEAESHDPDSALYACEDCGSLWDDGQRVAAIRDAERNGGGWRATRAFKGHASFHAPEMLSTFRRLRDIVKSYLGKIALEDMQSFVNVSLALTYDQRGEQADPTGLMRTAIDYPAEVPAGGLYITAGVDMQMDRLECEVVAWGDGERSWSLGYHVLWGDPEHPDVWADLEDLLASTYQHESGAVLPIMAACLDTGGTNGMTQAAYEFAKGRTGRRLFAIKGIAGWDRPIVEKPERKQSGKDARKVDLFKVGVDQAKLTVMRRLSRTIDHDPEQPEQGGHCYFPKDRDGEWYKQLTAEKLVTRYIKGQPVREWHKPDRARNEALDCRVYALAALKIMAPSFKRLAERLGVVQQRGFKPRKVEEQPANDNVPVQERAQEKPQVDKAEPIPETRPKIKRSKAAAAGRGGGWASRW